MPDNEKLIWDPSNTTIENDVVTYDPNAEQEPVSELEGIVSKMRAQKYPMEKIASVVQTYQKQEEEKKVEAVRIAKLKNTNDANAIFEAKKVKDMAMKNWSSELEAGSTFKNDKGVDYTLDANKQWTQGGEVVDQDLFKQHQLPQYYNQQTSANDNLDLEIDPKYEAVLKATKITAEQSTAIDGAALDRLDYFDKYNGGGEDFDDAYAKINVSAHENKYEGWEYKSNSRPGTGGFFYSPDGQKSGLMNPDGTRFILPGYEDDSYEMDAGEFGKQNTLDKTEKRGAFNRTDNIVKAVRMKEAINRIAKEKGISPRDVDVKSQEVKDLAKSLSKDDIRENVIKGITEQEKQDQIERNIENFIDQTEGAEGFKREDGSKGTKWYETGGFFKSEVQEEVSDIASKAYDERDKAIERIDIKQQVVSNEIDAIDDVLDGYGKESESIIAQIAKVKEGKFTTREEVDKANADITALQDKLRGLDSSYNTQLTRRKELVDTSGKMFENYKMSSKDLDKFEQYKDLLKRNYSGGATIGHGIVNWVATTGQNFDEFSYRFNPIRAIKDENGETPVWLESLDHALDIVAPMAGKSLGIDQATESDEDRKARHDGYNKWQEDWMSGVQKPKAFGEINGWYDFGEYSATLAGNQIPQLAFMYATGGLGGAMGLGATGMKVLQGMSMAIPSAGGKFREMQEEMDMYQSADGKPLYSNTQLYGIAMATGAVEALSEQVTFGQINKAMGMSSNAFTLGYKNYLKQSFTNTALNFGKDIVEEGGSEALATMGENALGWFRGGDHAKKSLWDGVPEAFVSGAMISIGIKAMGTAKNPTAAFTSKDTNQKRGEIGERLRVVADHLNKPDLSPELRKKYEGEKNLLVAQSNKILQADIKKVDLMSGTEKKALINIETDIMGLRKDAVDIAADESLTPEQKKVETDKLQEQVDALEAKKEDVLSRYTAMEAEENYQIEKQKLQNKIDATNKRNAKEGGTGRTVEMVETGTEQIAETQQAELAEIEAELEANQEVLKNSDPDSENAKIARSNIIEYNKRKNLLEDQSSQLGYISTDKDGNSKFFVNKDVNLKNNTITTPMHEFLHHALWATIKKNPVTQSQMGGAIIDVLNNNADSVNPKFLNKVKQYEGTPQYGEEVITTLSEAIKNGDVKFNENIFTKIGDNIRRFNQKNFPESRFGKIKFNNGRQVYNFIKDFNDSIEKGYESAAINNVIDKGAVGRLVDGKKVDPVKESDNTTYQSKIYQETDQIYIDNKARWGNERTRKRLAAGMAYGLEGNILGRLKNFEGLTYDKADIALDFIANEKRGLTGLIEGFDPLKMINKKTGKPYESVMAYLLSPSANGMSLIDARLLGFVQKNPKYGNIIQSMEQEGVQDKMEKQNIIDVNNESNNETVIEKESKRMFVNSLVIPDGKIESLIADNQSVYDQTVKEVQAELDQAIKDGTASEGTEVNLNEINKRFVGKVIANVVAAANVNIDGLTYKGVKKLLTSGGLKPVLQIFSDLYGVPIDKIINDSDLNQAQRGSAQNYFMLNSDSNVAGLPDGHTASGTATGVPRVLLNMVNPETGNTDLLYRKTASAKKAKTGSSAGLPLQVKQKNINKTHVQEAVGILRGKPNNAARGVDGMLRGFVMQGAMLAANQSVRQDALINAQNPYSVIKVLGDGKSDLYFAKIPKIDGGTSSINFDKVSKARFTELLDFMDQNKHLSTHPETAAILLASANGINSSEYDGAADHILAEVEKFKAHGITVADMESAVQAIKPPASFKSWNDVFAQRPDLKDFAPYNFGSKNENKSQDVAKYKSGVKEFLKGLPAEMLTNNMFLMTFHNSGAGDVFSPKEIKQMASEIAATKTQDNIQQEADRLSRLTYQDYTDIGGERAPNTDSIGYRTADSIVNESTSDYEYNKNRWERDYRDKKEMREKKSEEYLQTYKDADAKTKRDIEADARTVSIDFSKVGFSETLANNLQEIANSNTDLTVANKKMMDAIEKAGFSQVETSKALNLFMSGINDHVNEVGITAQERTNRMKMASTLFQQNTSFKKGMIRGGAPVVAVSMNPSKVDRSNISKDARVNTARAFGIEGKDAYTFGTILLGANPSGNKRIKAADIPRVKKMVERVLQERLTEENSSMTVAEYMAELKETMVAPQIKINKKGEVQAVSVESFQKIKERHDEHMTPLLSFTGNSLLNMADGTFEQNFPTEIKEYTRSLLNEEQRKIMDSMPGLKTGNVASDKRISPFARIIVAIPDAAKDMLMIGYNNTLDNVIASHIVSQQLRDQLTTPIVQGVETALGENTTYFSKNTDIVFENVDARDAFSKLISKHSNPQQAKVAAIELVKTMENINDINAVKANLLKAYPVLSNDMTLNEQLQAVAVIDNAIMFSKLPGQPTKGISILDFDDTLAFSKSLILYTKADGSKGTLTPAQYAKDYESMLGEGTAFDFSQFNEVVDGKIAPLFQKALKLQGKFSSKNMFVLTARPMESAPAIFAFLKANGLNIPLENITGLANSTAEAKAMWIAGKVGEGYNDIYFADDALQNVQVVKNVLDQMDVKSKVQQAKETYFSKISEDFNEVLEETKGIKKEATFSDAKARKRGAKKGKYDWFIPASAEDFKGLLYKFLAPGKKGESQMDFFRETLINPFAKAIRSIDAAKNRVSNDLTALNKRFKGINKTLRKTIPTGDFTYDTAVRVYNWTQAGIEIPGISKQDQADMIKAVTSDPNLVAYANGLNQVAGGAYPGPSNYWTTETIASDLYNMSEGTNRKQALAEFMANREQMFGKWENGKLVGPNMNKIEAVYGIKYREAMEDMLWRMENGTNRSFGGNRLTNRFANWVNNSVGAIMFLNMRSAALQTLSTVNFMNWSFNNPAKAAIAFANQPQFWKDFGMIFNSDMLKSRRSGLKTTVSQAELAEAASGSNGNPKAIFAKLIKMGFLPTQIADSFAIASGGATFYRNRVNDLLKKGVSESDAKTQAFNEFQEIAEETQQSARPDMISSQQASPLGRLILAFANTPMQYTRLIKKATLDLVNGRGDMKTNISKIIYYGAVQNVIFAALQKGLFALAFVGDDEEEKEEEVIAREVAIANSMLDSVLRGSGVGGAIVATLKNVLMKGIQEYNKGWNADEGKAILDFLSLSPPIGSKARKLNSGLKTLKFNDEVIKEMDLMDINNPVWGAVGQFVSFSTNIPLDRAIQKTINIQEALNSQNATWQRIALMMGWNTWDLDVDNSKVQEVREIVKEKKVIAKKEEKAEKKKIEKAIKDKEKKAQFDREVVCSVKTRKGKGPRCKNRTENKNGKCYAHQ